MLYGLLGFFLTPYLLEKNLVDRVQQDYQAELRIKKIDVNPFALSLKISGLELDSPEGDPTIRIHEAFTNFQLSSIFRLAFTFDEIRFTSVELFVTRDKNGEMNFSYLLASADTNSESDTVKSTEDSSLLHALIFRFAIEDFVINWTDQLPAEPIKTRFGPIAIDIKDLNTLPDLSAQQSVTIATENAGTLSWTGSLQLNPLLSSGHLKLTESHFPLVSAYIRHQSGIEIVDGSTNFEADYAVNQTKSGEIEARIDNINLALRDVTIRSFSDGTGFDFAGPDQQILKLPNMQLNDGAFLWPEQTVSLKSITIDNPKISVLRDENGVFNLEPRQADSNSHNSSTTSNTVVSQNGSASMPAATSSNESTADNPWQFSIDNLAVNGLILDVIDQSVSPQATLGISDFNLNISDISNDLNKRFPTTLSLQALSGGQLSLKGEMALLPNPEFDFDVVLDAIQLAVVQPYLKQQANLKLDSGAINLDGHMNGSAKEPFSFKGNLEVVDLLLAESVNDARLASWKKFRANKIALSLANRQLDVSELHFDQLYADILIDRSGSLNIGQIKKSDAGETNITTVATSEAVETKVTTEANESDFKIRVGDVALAEASADFADLSLPLPFAIKIDSINGKMTTISNQSSEPSEISLEGKVDEFGFVRISGFITPLQPPKNTNVMVQFDNIAIPKFTPYLIPFAGHKIANGSLDLKLGYQIKNSQLVGDNSIVLRDFKLGDKVPHPDALDIPLGLAVALLKDASGKIDIDLPIRGDIDDPKFSYGEVVKSTLGKLLLKIILSPFTLLGNLLGIEPNELDSITFLAGRADLTPPQVQRIGKLAEALSLRPALQLVINGVFDRTADGLALRTTRFDQFLALRITELATTEPTIQTTDQKRIALELLFKEQSATNDAPQKLDALRLQFTTLVEAEGQNPTETFDNLSYSSELRRQLIDLQSIDDNELTQLATARAKALKAGLIEINNKLEQRIIVAENTTAAQKDGKPIEMKVTLKSGSSQVTKE